MGFAAVLCSHCLESRQCGAKYIAHLQNPVCLFGDQILRNELLFNRQVAASAAWTSTGAQLALESPDSLRVHFTERLLKIP